LPRDCNYQKRLVISFKKDSCFRAACFSGLLTDILRRDYIRIFLSAVARLNCSSRFCKETKYIKKRLNPHL